MNIHTNASQSSATYDYWRSALAGNTLPIHEGEPQLGFYRKRTKKAGPFVPVAIWEQEGRVVALVDGQEADAAEIWSFVCQYPVTELQYRDRIATGKWHDEDEAVTQSLAHDIQNENADPATIMADQIDSALAGAADYQDIRSDEVAAKAQSLRSRLLELSGDADKKREAEKKPHLEAGRSIDAKWQPLVKKAKEAADAIRKALGAHETRKDQERRAAEEAYRKAEAYEAALAAASQPKTVTPLPQPTPAPAPAPEPVQTQVRGAYGRAATIKTIKVATVNDQDAAYGFLKGHKELVELIARLSQRAVDAGYAVPGVSVEERKDVR